MYRDFLTNKWIIGGFLLLIIIAGGCYFWYQHSLTDDRKAAADAAEYARRLENQKAKQEAATETETTSTQSPADSTTPTAEKSVNKVTGAETNTSTNKTTKPVIVSVQETDKTEEVRVSPHGFGPYPEIPEGSPFDEFHFEESDTRTMELLGRVEIKAWINGERFEGSSYDSQYGKVYLHYPNTLYVEYDDPIIEADGTVRIPITDTLGAGDVRLTSEQMKNGEIPGGVRVLSLRDDGIDPYEYLDLQ